MDHPRHGVLCFVLQPVDIKDEGAGAGRHPARARQDEACHRDRERGLAQWILGSILAHVRGTLGAEDGKA